MHLKPAQRHQRVDRRDAALVDPPEGLPGIDQMGLDVLVLAGETVHAARFARIHLRHEAGHVLGHRTRRGGIGADLLDPARPQTRLLDDLAAGKQPKIGPQIERQTSCPEGGPTSLKEMVSENHDYRGSW